MSLPGPAKRIPCTCKTCKCKKGYCICFAAGLACMDSCDCFGCENRDDAVARERREALATQRPPRCAVKPREYRKRQKGVLRVPSRKAKLSKVVADFIHRARGNIVRAHPVNPSMETGRDIADRFNMQKWFLDASITELDNLDRTINTLEKE